MAPSIDFLAQAETVIQKAFPHHFEQIEAQKELYNELITRSHRLLKYLYEKQKDIPKLERLESDLKLTLNNLGLRPSHYPALFNAAQEHAAHLHNPSAAIEVEEKPKPSPRPVYKQIISSFAEEETHPKDSKIPSHPLSEVKSKDYYPALIKQGGEVAQQAWLFADRNRKYTHSMGQHTHENWRLTVCLKELGIPYEAMRIKSAIKRNIQKNPEMIGERPVSPPQKQAPRLPDTLSPDSCYAFLQSQQDMVRIATNYIVTRYINDQGEFTDPGRKALKDKIQFRRLLMQEIEGCDTNEQAEALQNTLLEYVQANAALLHQNSSQSRKRS